MTTARVPERASENAPRRRAQETTCERPGWRSARVRLRRAKAVVISRRRGTPVALSGSVEPVGATTAPPRRQSRLRSLRMLYDEQNACTDRHQCVRDSAVALDDLAKVSYLVFM
jgi:hypothetical protein